jgi:uncharacterized protein
MRILVIAVVLLLSLATAQADVAVPSLTARVTDLTATLSPAQRQAMEQELFAFEQRKGVQIAVLLVPTTAPETIEQYSIRVVDRWRLGRKGVDDGLLLLVAKDDRTLRIEVGYGLEGVVPDAVANRVINEIIVPRFRDGDFAGGIQAGVDRLMRIIDGEPLPPPKPQAQVESPVGNALPFLVFAFFMISGVLNRVLGRLFGATVTGGVMGVLFMFIVGSLAAAIGIALLAFVIALFTGGAMGAGGLHGMGRGGFGGGRGGFGGGGFGGGGGGFGGGGASGRW